MAMIAVASVAVLAGYDSASAQSTTNTITVNTTDDENTPGDGKCSLREAIQNANDDAQKASSDCKAGSGEDTVAFEKGLNGTITLDLSLGPLTVTDPAGLTIDGRRENITLSGSDEIQVFVLPGESEGAKLHVNNLTVARGFANDQNNPDNVGDRGGGIVNDGGTLTVTRSTFSGNNALFIGGGIANLNGGTLEVSNSTFSANRAFAGGAIVNGGTLWVAYSTFSGNDAEGVGGGIENANVAKARATLSNTIFEKSAKGNIHNACVEGSCQGTITDGGYNISDDSSFAYTNSTSKGSTEPLLDPNGLQNNGGPTETIALQEGSPAIDYIPKGESGCHTPVKADQRGVKRPQGKACDVGAYELKKK